VCVVLCFFGLCCGVVLLCCVCFVVFVVVGFGVLGVWWVCVFFGCWVWWVCGGLGVWLWVGLFVVVWVCGVVCVGVVVFVWCVGVCECIGWV
jgi:hypothetical protein